MPNDGLPKRYAELAALLIDAGIACVILGRSEDRDAARDINGIDLIGQTDLMMLMGVLSHCSVVVAKRFGRAASRRRTRRAGCRHLGADGRALQHSSDAVRGFAYGRRDLRVGVLPPLLSRRLPDRPPVHETYFHRAGARCRPPVSPGESHVSQRAVFLDRDGTMIEDVGYLDRLERLKLFPYTIDAVRLLNRAGYKVVVVTSQNGVAQGVLTEAFLGEAHAHLSQLFEDAGAKIEGYYYCPHSTHAAVERYRTDCECRKPKPGMILAAARDHSLDVSQSFVIGDRWRDIEMGLAAGTQRAAG